MMAGKKPLSIALIASHRYPIADREQLIELVRDENDGDAISLQILENEKEIAHLAFGERRRRFV